jgi:hypothetical protein
MTDRYRQGLGRRKGAQRRVDVSNGRLIKATQDIPRAQTIEMRSLTIKKPTHVLFGFVVCLASMLILTACASQPAGHATKNSIEIESLRLTAAGHYIDLRYRVLDAERASQSIGPGVKPLLIDEATGTVMAVPMTAKLGALRQTRGIQKPEHLYFVLFVNGAGLEPGSRVTAEIGDMRFESLTIE